MTRQRKRYTPEFKTEAAMRVIDSSRPIAQVAKEIGLNPTLLGKWVAIERERLSSIDGMSSSDMQKRIRQLERRNAELEKDNEFLSKAAAFFAAKQR